MGTEKCVFNERRAVNPFPDGVTCTIDEDRLEAYNKVAERTGFEVIILAIGGGEYPAYRPETFIRFIKGELIDEPSNNYGVDMIQVPEGRLGVVINGLAGDKGGHTRFWRAVEQRR